jgi:membrane fusion protein (multidrug efflux system)
MKGKIAVAILILIVIISMLAIPKVLQIKTLIKAGEEASEPPVKISTVVVREEKWQGLVKSIGTVVAVHGVTLTPEIAGTVQDITFESGAVVAKDDVLLRMDVSSEEAQLRAVESQAELARINLKRAQALRADNTVSQSELDTAEATLKQYEANADAIRTTIRKKTIRAPFAGRLGIRQVNLGQYLDAGKSIVSLQSLEPVYVNFSLPQQELSRIKTGMRVRITSDASPDREFEGALTAVNPDLDPVTRSVGLQATFENGEQVLRPGMFVRVNVLLPEEKAVLVIPATAVLSAPFGDSVYVVESRQSTNGAAAGLFVRQQFIRLGQNRGNLLSVESGLKAGDRIVGAGLFKLRNDMPVTENNAIAPDTSATTAPSDS